MIVLFSPIFLCLHFQTKRTTARLNMRPSNTLMATQGVQLDGAMKKSSEIQTKTKSALPL